MFIISNDKIPNKFEENLRISNEIEKKIEKDYSAIIESDYIKILSKEGEIILTAFPTFFSAKKFFFLICADLKIPLNNATLVNLSDNQNYSYESIGNRNLADINIKEGIVVQIIQENNSELQNTNQVENLSDELNRVQNPGHDNLSTGFLN